MKKTIQITVTALFLALGACATEINTAHISKMQSMIGASEKQLIIQWGVPDKVYQLDKHTKVVSYIKESYFSNNQGFGFSTCAGSFPGRHGYSTCVEPIPTQTRTVRDYCELSFNVTEGRVTNWFQNGNSCPRIR